MTDTNRTNQVISKALNTSPLARKYHDQNYNVFFTYATADNNLRDTEHGFVPAYIRVPRDEHYKDLKLVFNPKHDDRLLISSIYHELTHINQFARARAKNMPVMDYQLSYDNNMALHLIWEAQAFANQVEGPIMGYMNDLKNNNFENAEFYKKQFEYKVQYTTGFEKQQNVFLKGLLNGKMPFGNTFENVAYGYFNDLSMLSDEDMGNRKTAGRKNLINHFFQTQLMLNNDQMDYYINDVGKHYNADFDMVLNQMKERGINILQMNRSMRDPDKAAYLKDIIETTNDNDQQYLPTEDWNDILQAKDTSQLVNRCLQSSRYKDGASGNRRRSFVI